MFANVFLLLKLVLKLISFKVLGQTFLLNKGIFFFVTEFEQQREVKENGGFLERVLWGIWLFRGWKNALQL